MQKQSMRGITSACPHRSRLSLLSLCLLLLILVVPLLRTLPARASAPLSVTLTAQHFDLSFLDVAPDNLSNFSHATFTLTNTAQLWYGIAVQSSPSGLKLTAADPTDDLVGAIFAAAGLLQPSDVIPFHADNTLYQNLHLTASFSAPNQEMKLALDPFDRKAVDLDAFGLVFDFLSLEQPELQALGLLKPNGIQQIIADIDKSEGLVKFVNDFVSGWHALSTGGDAVGKMVNAATDLFNAFKDSKLRQALVAVVADMAGQVSSSPEIGQVVAKILNGDVLTVLNIAAFFAGYLDMFIFLVAQGFQLPTVTLQSFSGNPPTPTKTQPNFAPFIGDWAQESLDLTINPEGTATYGGRVFIWCTDDPRPPCDSNSNHVITGGLDTQITFTSVSGSTAYGTITGGTGDRDSNGNIIPVGSNFSVTLNPNDTLTASDGVTFCRYSVYFMYGFCPSAPSVSTPTPTATPTPKPTSSPTPTATPTPTAVQLLGDLPNLIGYCLALGYANITLVDNTSLGWRCVDQNGNLYPIDMNAACRWQYPTATNVYAVAQDPNDAMTWVCYGIP